MAAYSYNHTLVKEYTFTKLSSQGLYLTILLHQVKIIYFKDPAATRATMIYSLKIHRVGFKILKLLVAIMQSIYIC
jgi:hypothetical protein